MKKHIAFHYLNRTTIIALGIFFPLSLQAFTITLPPPADESHNAITKKNVWSINPALGYTHFSNMVNEDGNVAVGRLSFDSTFYQTNQNEMGLELGFQTGNTGRLQVSNSIIAAIGGIPVRFTIKPILDFLFTFKHHIKSTQLFLIAKGGGAYRQLDFTSESNTNLSKIDPEAQVGFGRVLSKHANISLLYQGIYALKPINFNVDMATLYGRISTIPTQQSLLINFEVII